MLYIRRPFSWASIALALGTILVSEHLAATPINYSINEGFQAAWTGILDVSDITLPIGTTPTASPSVSVITAVTGTTNLSFVPTSYTVSGTSIYSSPVVSWGGNAGKAFFSIYSTDFYNFVSGSGTWSSALGQTFTVQAAVGYAEDYEVLQLFTDGGSITFPVPEPATYAMALAGLACGGLSLWRRWKGA